MPQFMTIHRAPGLLKESWVEMSPAVYNAQHARYVGAHVNLATGFIFTIFEAADREALIDQFEEFGFPFDEIHEVQFSQTFDEMKQMLQHMGKI